MVGPTIRHQDCPRIRGFQRIRWSQTADFFLAPAVSIFGWARLYSQTVFSNSLFRNCVFLLLVLANRRKSADISLSSVPYFTQQNDANYPPRCWPIWWQYWQWNWCSKIYTFGYKGKEESERYGMWIRKLDIPGKARCTLSVCVMPILFTV